MECFMIFRILLRVVIECHVVCVLQCNQPKAVSLCRTAKNKRQDKQNVRKEEGNMMFYLAAASAVIFGVCGMLLYRLGVSDGITLRKSNIAEGLFGKKNPKREQSEDWQSIIGYDPKK